MFQGQFLRQQATTIMACVALSALVLTTACGGAIRLNRQAGAHKYRALPLGTPIQVVETESQLGIKFAVIGGLRWKVTSSHAEPDLQKAKQRFGTHAPRYGCDVVAGVQVKSSSKTTKKRVRELGADGKTTHTMKDVTRYTHEYTGRCVRSEKAPGGLVEGSEQTAELSDDAKPPVLDVGATATAGTKLETKRKASPDAERMWVRLGAYKSNFLKNWRDGLIKAPDDDMQVLEAYSELMIQVIGPAGFWRKTVRVEWFGCPADPKQEQCAKLNKATATFRSWERMRKTMDRQKPAGAAQWLHNHATRMNEFLDNLVPARPNLTGMQQTQLYIEKIR